MIYAVIGRTRTCAEAWPHCSSQWFGFEAAADTLVYQTCDVRKFAGVLRYEVAVGSVKTYKYQSACRDHVLILSFAMSIAGARRISHSGSIFRLLVFHVCTNALQFWFLANQQFSGCHSPSDQRIILVITREQFTCRPITRGLCLFSSLQAYVTSLAHDHSVSAGVRSGDLQGGR